MQVDGPQFFHLKDPYNLVLACDVTEAGGGEEELPGLKVVVRELDDVLLKDVGNRIRDSGKLASINPIQILLAKACTLMLHVADIHLLSTRVAKRPPSSATETPTTSTH